MNKSGFTLIELLLAISIFGILSSIVIVGYRNNESSRNFETQALKIIEGLNSAQNRALTGAIVDNNQPDFFRFMMTDCEVDCFYKIIAVSNINGEPIETVIEEISLPELSIDIFDDSQLDIDFKVPRAVITSNISGAVIKLDLISAKAKKADNSSLNYCLLINTISGRFELSSNSCSAL